MATTKKTGKTKSRNTGSKEKSRFEAVQSLYKTRDNWVETMREYNDKYIMKPYGNTKDLVVDMKKNPRKQFEEIFNQSKTFVKDVQKDPKQIWQDMVNNGKDMAGDARKDFQKAVDNMVEGGRDFYKAMGNDLQTALDDFMARGKKMMDRIPGKRAVEKGLHKGLESVPEKLNLPSKKDMEKLSKTVRTLNTKLNTLSKQYSV